MLYGRPQSMARGGGGMRSPEELANAMKEKLKTRGARGFIGLLQGLDEEQLEYKGLVHGRARLVKRLQAMVE